MAWPKNLNKVGCHGFDRKYLPLIKKALEESKAKWIEVNTFAETCSATFELYGAQFSLLEIYEEVQEIGMAYGETLDEKKLILAILAYEEDRN